MNNSMKNLLIGVFVLGALSLLVGMVFFLKPHVGDMKKTLHTRFSNINQIGIGTQVLYAGRPVGEVIDIKQIADPRKDRDKCMTDILGRLYIYELTIKYDSSVTVYSTDEIAIQTSGLLGEKSIAIVPRKPAKGITPKIITDQPICANSVDPIESTFDEITDLAHQAEDALTFILKWFHQNADTLSTSIRNFSDAMAQAEITFREVNHSGIINHFQESLDVFRETAILARRGLEELERKDTFSNFGDAIASARQTSSNVSYITGRVASGQGVLGKLIEHDDLYYRFTSAFGKFDTLMNDINNFGLLFNMNKHWQRMRLQRACLLSDIDTPKEFKNYFQTEVDEIVTSMGRLNMLLEKTKQDDFIQDLAFQKEYKELLNSASDLNQQLHIFSEKLVPKEDSCK